MRNTKQRQIIMDTLVNNPLHPTADILYAQIRRRHPSISLGTVYRNLNLLASEGKIKKIKGISSREHFDHNTFDHCHIICEKCSRVADIMLPPRAKLTEKLAENTNFKITGCEVLLKGLCKKCSQKEKKQ